MYYIEIRMIISSHNRLESVPIKRTSGFLINSAAKLKLLVLGKSKIIGAFLMLLFTAFTARSQGGFDIDNVGIRATYSLAAEMRNLDEAVSIITFQKPSFGTQRNKLNLIALSATYSQMLTDVYLLEGGLGLLISGGTNHSFGIDARLGIHSQETRMFNPFFEIAYSQGLTLSAQNSTGNLPTILSCTAGMTLNEITINYFRKLGAGLCYMRMNRNYYGLSLRIPIWNTEAGVGTTPIF